MSSRKKTAAAAAAAGTGSTGESGGVERDWPTLPIVRVVAGIVWKGERVLCGQRPQGKKLAGYWEFPGGKVEEGESPEDALKRELFEETGIRVLEYCPLVVFSNESIARRDAHAECVIHLHFMTVTRFEGEPYSKEGQQLSWVHFSDLARINMLPANWHLLPKLWPPVSLVKGQ